MTASGDVYSTTFGSFTYVTVLNDAPEDVVITITAVDASGNETKTTRIVTVHSLAECFI